MSLFSVALLPSSDPLGVPRGVANGRADKGIKKQLLNTSVKKNNVFSLLALYKH